jgi:hypothetical protein
LDLTPIRRAFALYSAVSYFYGSLQNCIYSKTLLNIDSSLQSNMTGKLQMCFDRLLQTFISISKVKTTGFSRLAFSYDSPSGLKCSLNGNWLGAANLLLQKGILLLEAPGALMGGLSVLCARRRTHPL